MRAPTHWVEDRSEAVASQWRSLHHTCGLHDASKRGRLCLVGADRARFLHGQLTQEVKGLQPGEGAYAALADARGRFLCDLNLYCLEEEFLLDFDADLVEAVQQRLERYLVSEDVSVIDASPLVKMLTLQGPRAGHLLQEFLGAVQLPSKLGEIRQISCDLLDEDLYLSFRPRGVSVGFDLFLPISSSQRFQDALLDQLVRHQGHSVGELAMEMLRIESGLPRTGYELTASVLVQEAGLERAMISFNKGCYIGQEVISRIKTAGRVPRQLTQFILPELPPDLKQESFELVAAGKACGWLTSVAVLPDHPQRAVALGYVSTAVLEANQVISLLSADGSEMELSISGPIAAYHPELG